jgi:hypothetical protein
VVIEPKKLEVEKKIVKSVKSQKKCILFLKNGLKKICRKKYKNRLGRNDYEVCTAVARCFPNILDVIVLENIN